MTKHSNSFRGKVLKDSERNSKSDSKYLNLPEGVELYMAEIDVRKIKLDFLPYVVSDSNHPCKNEKDGTAVKDSLWYRRPFKVHRSVGTDNLKFICPTSIGKKCPICEYQKKLYDQGRPKEETVPLYPQRRSLYIVVDVEGEGTPLIWNMADKMLQDMLVKRLKEEPDNEVFPSLEEGKTLEIRLKWDSIGEKGKPFPEAVDIDFIDREAYSEKVLDEVPDLDTVLIVPTYEELHAKFFELDVEDTGGKLSDVKEEDENPPERKRRSLREVEPEKEEEKVPARRSLREVKEEKAPERRSARREPEPEKEKPPRRSSRREVEKEIPKGKCPYGHIFGKDIDNTNDCPECAVYDDCLDENEKVK
jgi:hypothetical protein